MLGDAWVGGGCYDGGEGHGMGQTAGWGGAREVRAAGSAARLRAACGLRACHPACAWRASAPAFGVPHTRPAPTPTCRSPGVPCGRARHRGQLPAVVGWAGGAPGAHARWPPGRVLCLQGLGWALPWEGTAAAGVRQAGQWGTGPLVEQPAGRGLSLPGRCLSACAGAWRRSRRTSRTPSAACQTMYLTPRRMPTSRPWCTSCQMGRCGRGYRRGMNHSYGPAVPSCAALAASV